MLSKHPFYKKYQKQEAACLAEIVDEYNRLLDDKGSNAAIRGEKTCDAGDNEGIIKVYMPDKTYRTMLVKTSQTTSNFSICAI